MVVFPGLYDYFLKPNQTESYTFYYPCSSPIQCSPIKLRFPPGKFKIECWGAQGGTSENVEGGKGGYTSGEIELTKYVNAFLYIGAQGYTCDNFEESVNCYMNNTFNGGGSGKSLNDKDGLRLSTSGGGGTDIRFQRDTFNHRVIVAGGGGGSGSGTQNYIGSFSGGVGGGNQGGDGTRSDHHTSYQYGTGANQTDPGYIYNFLDLNKGDFGVGGDSYLDGCGGGGGWYGGGGGKQAASGGGGGSGFILTESTSSFPDSYAFKNKQFSFSNIELKDGSLSFLTPNSLEKEETGHSGNGAIRITLLKLSSYQKYFCYLHTQQLKFSFSPFVHIYVLFS